MTITAAWAETHTSPASTRATPTRSHEAVPTLRSHGGGASLPRRLATSVGAPPASPSTGAPTRPHRRDAVPGITTRRASRRRRDGQLDVCRLVRRPAAEEPLPPLGDDDDREPDRDAHEPLVERHALRVQDPLEDPQLGPEQDRRRRR